MKLFGRKNIPYNRSRLQCDQGSLHIIHAFVPINTNDSLEGSRYDALRMDDKEEVPLQQQRLDTTTPNVGDVPFITDGSRVLTREQVHRHLKVRTTNSSFRLSSKRSARHLSNISSVHMTSYHSIQYSGTPIQRTRKIVDNSSISTDFPLKLQQVF